MDLTERSARATDASAAATKLSLEQAQTDAERHRLEWILDRVESAKHYADRLYTMDPDPGGFASNDESARAPLQALLVGLRAFLAGFPDERFPKCRELAGQGVMSPVAAPVAAGWVQRLYMESVDEVEQALRSL